MHERVKSKHADLRVADLQVEAARTKLKELESTFYLKLQVTTWVAPMFTVSGSASSPRSITNMKASATGVHFFEARLVQVLSTLDGLTLQEAAELNTKVEEAKRQLVRRASSPKHGA